VETPTIKKTPSGNVFKEAENVFHLMVGVSTNHFFIVQTTMVGGDTNH
jgi:hypothetical protein